MKEKIRTEHMKRIKAILITKLNAGNMMKTRNTW